VNNRRVILYNYRCGCNFVIERLAAGVLEPRPFEDLFGASWSSLRVSPINDFFMNVLRRPATVLGNIIYPRLLNKFPYLGLFVVPFR